VLELSNEVKYLKGVGPHLTETLAEKNIRTVEDFLYHLPFRYEDRLNPQPLSAVQSGEVASVIAEVRGSILLRTRKMPILEVTVGEGTATMKCIWFHGTYLKDRFRVGQLLALHGHVDASRSGRGPLKMIQPQFEILPSASQRSDDDPSDFLADLPAGLLEVGRIVPIYRSLGGQRLTSRWIRRVLFRALADLGDRIPDTLPAALLKRLSLPSLARSLHEVHFPPAETPVAELARAATPAHQRLIFEELFFLELGLEIKRRRMRDREGIAFSTTPVVREAIKQVLPFHPTAAQKRVFAEIVADMRRPSPMRRLLQGDVGSGKTIVALEAAILAIENGYQAALMAPTEILATQHYIVARKLMERRPYNIALLTGSLEEDRKRSVRGRIMRGEAQLVIGTHALIEKSTDFLKLGLVIVDEQHRFGVMQRFKLMKKPNAAEPDVLVMTATPIPRSLALTLYGDLDLSVLDELPPGRTPIHTRLVAEKDQAQVWRFVRDEVAAGHQAYIVYPVIEGPAEDEPELDFAAAERAPDPEFASSGFAASATARKKSAGARSAKSSSKSDDFKLTGAPAARPARKPSASRLPLKSATEMYDSLRAGPLAGLRLGLLHGRMAPDEKEITMRRFQRGELDVLVSTTVIEVGVDVPNATVMVIEHAERFGLAQLHQLRGRVGRGAAASHCILLTGPRVTDEAQQRLDAMVRTQNGFELAELDLELRGPGEFFGTRQAGLPGFRIANIVRDRKVLELARREAAAFLQSSSTSLGPDDRSAIMQRLREHWRRRYGLIEA
jgi:ATP-dependent DNA helicase RecG